MKQRETFASRLGFVLISAGCAIGLGNVWRFPYIVGQYGGAAFVLIYLFFLVVMGLPIMAMEFSVGRASQKSIAVSFHALEPQGGKWHIYSWFGMAGNYMLMMFYTTVAGWMLLYFVRMAKGDFQGLDPAGVQGAYVEMLSSPGIMLVFMALVVLLGFLLTERKRVYLILGAAVAVFWLAHMLNCLRIGYVSPVEDAANLLRLMNFPLYVLTFVTALEGRPQLRRTFYLGAFIAFLERILFLW